jgi:phosphonate transport system ATP-binding protein
MLVLDRVTRRFGATVAVSDVSIEIQPESFVGVIGRSGAGKSTMLRMINRLIDPTEGRIVFDGTDVTRLRGRRLREWRAGAAMIFQHFNLVPRLDVVTNVLLGRLSRHGTLPSLFNRFTAAERAMAVELLERFDLIPHAFQRAGTLSGGQQQRVAIARALMQQPSIILADEPIASLDPRNAARVMDSLRAINRDEGLTVLCNLHTLDAARQYCERIIGVAKGRIVFDGVPTQLTSDVVRTIYQVEEHEADLPEEITSSTSWLSLPSEIATAPA